MNSKSARFICTLSLSLATGTAKAEEAGLFSSQSLTLETALMAASAALKKCRDEGFQVSVAITVLINMIFTS